MKPIPTFFPSFPKIAPFMRFLGTPASQSCWFPFLHRQNTRQIAEKAEEILDKSEASENQFPNAM